MSPLFVPPGMLRIGSQRFSASAQTSSILAVPPYEILTIYFNITGYSGSAIASLRFNNDSTAGNYSSSYSPLTSTTKTNTLGTFAGAKLGQNAVTVQRSGQIIIYNYLGRDHIWICTSTTQASATSAPVTSVGSGNYVSSANAQITQVQLITDTSGITMPTGTGFIVYGDTP